MRRDKIYRITESFSGEYSANHPSEARMKFRKEHSFLKKGVIGPQDQTSTISDGDEEKERKEQKDASERSVWGTGLFAMLFIGLQAPYMALAVLAISYFAIKIKKTERAISAPPEEWADENTVFLGYSMGGLFFAGAFLGTLLVSGVGMDPMLCLKVIAFGGFFFYVGALLEVKGRF